MKQFKGSNYIILLLLAALCSIRAGAQTYCTPPADDMPSIYISSVTLGTTTHASGSSNGYQNFANITATAYAGEYLSLSITSNNPMCYSFWLDTDNDSAFSSSGEEIGVFNNGNNASNGGSAVPSGITTITVLLPIPAGITGLHRLRIRGDGYNNALSNPCTAVENGETEDYTLSISAPPCPATISASGLTATAQPGTTSTMLNWTMGNGTNHLVIVKKGSAPNVTTITNGTTYTADATFGSGSMVDGGYVVYAGNTQNVTVTGLAFDSTYYAAVVEYNANTGCMQYKTTSPATVTFVQQLAYCIPSVPNYGSGGATDSVTIGTTTTVNNFANAYNDYTGTPISVVAGSTVPINITFYNDPTMAYSIWLDVNNDGIFSNTEYLATASSTTIGTYKAATVLTIPSGITGPHRLRIISDTSPSGGAPSDACNTQYGDVEDYTLNVSTPPPTGPTITNLLPATNICQGGSVAVTFTAANFTAGNVFTAQLSNAAGGFTSPVAIGTLTSTLGGTINAVLPIASTTGGSAYRIRIVSSSPAITGADNGSNFTVILAPTAASVLISPATASFCAGGSIALSVPSATGINYQWALGTTTISGATAPTYTATAAGSYTVTATNAQGCTRTSGAKTVTQLALPTATITPATAQTVATGQTVTFSVNTTSGAAYQWYNNGTPISGATSTTYVASASGSYSVVVTNSSGCSKTSSSVSLTVGTVTTSVAVGSLPLTSFCQGITFSIPYTVTGTYNSGNVFTAQLSDATGSFTSPVTVGTLTATASGTINGTISVTQAAGTAYRIRIVSSSPATTSAANGSNLSVLAVPTAAQTQITPTNNVTICQGNSTTLSVPATTGYAYLWQVNGANASGGNANSITVSAGGTYTVTVTNTSGCSTLSAGRTVTVIALPTAAITPATTQNLCTGTVTLSATTGTGYAYQWLNNGTAIAGATNATYTPTTVGSYTVQVTNATSGCQATSAAVSVINSCGVTITNTSGTVSLCTGSTIAATFNATAFNTGNVFTLQLSDSSGSFTNAVSIGTLTGTSGTGITGTIPTSTLTGDGYKLRIVTSSPVTTGAASALTIQVRNAIINAINLCAVTVDSATGKNKLIWTKPQTNNIDSFVFYRQSDLAVWTRIGAVPYAAYSAWVDTSSDPKALAQSYYLTAKNSCGETAMGTVNRTIHLNINKGTDNNTWNLIWNNYEGLTYSVFNIYRGTTTTNLQLLHTIVAHGDNSFTDYNAPAGTIYYKITIADGPVCNPGFKTTGTGGGVEIASNVATSGVAFAANWVDMTVYPNPGTTGTLLIESSNNTDVYTVHIMDITGRLLQTVTATTPNTPATFGSDLAAGLYTIDAVNATGDKHVVKKWVKQ